MILLGTNTESILKPDFHIITWFKINQTDNTNNLRNSSKMAFAPRYYTKCTSHIHSGIKI